MCPLHLSSALQWGMPLFVQLTRDGGSTWCHRCGELLIERDWYELGRWGLTADGCCAACGERLPGVRELAKRRKLSVATVVASYRQLEADGYLSATSRSGYFVKARYQPPPLSSTPLLQATPSIVSSQQMALTLSKAAADSRYMALGAAVPAPAFLPLHALQKALQHIVHEPHTLRGLQRLRCGAQKEMGKHHATDPHDDGQDMGELERVVEHGVERLE